MARWFQTNISEDLEFQRYSIALQEATEAFQVAQKALNQMKSGDFILSKEKSVMDLQIKDGHFVNPAGENFTRDLLDRPLKAALDLKDPLRWKLAGAEVCRAQAAEALKAAGIAPAFAVRDASGKHPAFVAARFATYNGTKIGYVINLGKEPQDITIADPSGKIMKLRNWFQAEGKKSDDVTKLHLGPCEFMNFDLVE